MVGGREGNLARAGCNTCNTEHQHNAYTNERDAALKHNKTSGNRALTTEKDSLLLRLGAQCSWATRRTIVNGINISQKLGALLDWRSCTGSTVSIDTS